MQAVHARKSPAGTPGQTSGAATHYHESAVIVPQPHVERLLSRLSGVRRTRNGWTARCPAHNDRRPSLSIAVTDTGRILLHCFADCTPEAVLAAVGLHWSDLGRPATPDERFEADLRRRFDQACFKAACDVAEWARVLDGRTYEERFALARYLHLVPYLDDLRERLLADELEARLAALEEAERWLL